MNAFLKDFQMFNSWHIHAANICGMRISDSPLIRIRSLCAINRKGPIWQSQREKVISAAFPQTIDVFGVNITGLGLSKREYFAGLAMAGKSDCGSIAVNQLAKWSVEYADALIAELEKGGKA